MRSETKELTLIASCAIAPSMELTRTARVKVKLDVKVAKTFIDAYTAACQFASEIAFTLKRPSDIKELNRLCYYIIREK